MCSSKVHMEILPAAVSVQPFKSLKTVISWLIHNKMQIRGAISCWANQSKPCFRLQVDLHGKIIIQTFVNKLYHLLGIKKLALAFFLKDMTYPDIKGGKGVEDDSTSMKSEDIASMKTVD